MTKENIEDMVLAVLLNYNQNDYTLKCVDSLLDSDYSNLKILVIDNGSTKNNVIELERKLPSNENLYFKKIIENIGYAKGTNYGLSEGLKLNPKYFLIINNDTIIDNQAVTELVKTSKEYNDRARVTGKVYHYDKPETLQFVAYKVISLRRWSFKGIGVDEKDIGQYDQLKELELMEDIFVLHPARLYNECGGYNPYLWVAGVNKDMSFRSVNAGYKLVFNSKAKIWHKGKMSLGGKELNPKLAFWNLQSKLILAYLYLPKHWFLLYYVRLFVNNVMRTKVKSITFKGYNTSRFTDYANAKFKAYHYFNKWVFTKNENSGYNPYQ